MSQYAKKEIGYLTLVLSLYFELPTFELPNYSPAATGTVQYLCGAAFCGADAGISAVCGAGFFVGPHTGRQCHLPHLLFLGRSVVSAHWHLAQKYFY